ncbi:sensor histidine kinase PilS, PAS domain-containing [Citrifermentans bemidjiense Bem]|uniref:histidine kinase n=1 Tax=Citrifermentans bemidjiense (strain ATCC BAA-1014 / DSM 16622 / JCM 12645 / Bem) TaxID=404380 RepID=B5EGW7_CITBB|nr:sensor histidine kinase PilS, PAS domain-containing [Citrifermentans bemidjiense Bem]
MIDRKRVFWFILLRLLVVSIFLATTTFLDVRTYDVGTNIAHKVLIRLMGATYLFSLGSLVVLYYSRRQIRTLTYAQIVWDLILVTVMILISGGVTSPYAFLYFLSIISASTLLARSQAYYTASLCVILYGAILDLQYYGKLAPLGLSPFPAQQYGAQYLFFLIFMYCAAFFLTALLAGHLSERARLSESALQEKAIDYEELERLNSLIVSTIDSGLLTINSDGRIRVFNRYAEHLTGVSQQDAYDHPLAEVLPGVAPFAGLFFQGGEGEFTHKGVDGRELLFSFKSVPLTGKDGATVGAIFDLHDLTEMKRLAAGLKRADRLAAVGELSARMAHEIRNPLAAISGSVQLVALRPWADEKDKRLFSIILRETDRLDGLLRDFLFYAKPTQPTKIPLKLRRVIADLCSLLSTDPRLRGVTIENRVPEELVVVFDKDQCSQVFWNLVVNSAEAIAGEGTIVIDACAASNGEKEEARISVRDSGSGMKQADVKRVFEPFFTTKKGGTGLGLATVYRIVETHGGRMVVDSAEGAGTTVTLYLPT